MKTKLPLFCLCTIAFGLPSQGQVAMAGSYLNTSQLTGGQVATGDILEIRAVISVPSGTVYTKVSYADVVPAGTSFVTGSLKAVTNEGVIVGAIANTGTYTDAADADRGKIAGSNITINMGDGASSATGGTITGATTKPLFYSSASILMAAYRVKVTAAIGSTITLGGTFFYTIGAVAQSTTLTTTTIRISALATCGLVNVANVLTAETNGTFSSGTTQNRGAASPNVAGFTFAGIAANNPVDGQYSLIKNTSPTQYTGGAPAGTDKVFGVWDIFGDHTGTNNAAGNAPVANGVSGGYMLAVNATYAPASVFSVTIPGLTTNTDYTLSLWIRNVCPTCGANPNSNASSGTPGVKPNLAFQLNSQDYYTTGEIAYSGGWVQKSFTFNTGASTSYLIGIKNNAPGGGGNDWVIDDIALKQCLAIVLPLKLLDFGAIAADEAVVLNWKTAEEVNTSYFQIERSTNGIEFKPVGKVAARTSATSNSYQYTDQGNGGGQPLYYRLKMVDQDEQYTYSKVVTVQLKNKGADKLTVYPNPATDQTNLLFKATAAGSAIISLQNAVGSGVYKTTIAINKGMNQVPLEAAGKLVAGIYIIRVQMNDQSIVSKLVIW